VRYTLARKLRIDEDLGHPLCTFTSSTRRISSKLRNKCTTLSRYVTPIVIAPACELTSVCLLQKLAESLPPPTTEDIASAEDLGRLRYPPPPDPRILDIVDPSGKRRSLILPMVLSSDFFVIKLIDLVNINQPRYTQI
jgi:hypothetical protein